MSANHSPTPLVPLTFPLHGSHLIEASAGTGKTYTLAALYVRLALNHGARTSAHFGRTLLPPEILVVTFTEAATRELRERIRDRLAQAARCFAGREVASDPFLRALLDDYSDDQHQQCARHLDAAAQWMDDAAIYTIHGFCNRMLRQHAFDSGSLFSLELEQDEQSLQERAAEDYWRTFVAPLHGTISDRYHQHWACPDELLSAVRPLLREGEKLPGNSGPQSTIERIEQATRQLSEQAKAPWRDGAGQLLTLFEAAWQEKRLAKSKPAKSADIKRWLAALDSWANDSEQLLPTLTDTAYSRLQPQSLAEASSQIDALLSHPCLAQLAELSTLQQQLPAMLPPLLSHAARWISARLQSYKQQQGMMGFDDMLSRLDHALQGPRGERLAATIRAQFPVAMIDEFQDTDPVQYRIFNALYGNANQADSGLAWLMIGDPKQAIYAFRGGDIYTYLAARRATEGHHHTLATNYRSAEPLVAAINQVFTLHAAQQADGPFLYRDIPFLPVQANGRKEQLEIDGDCPAPLTFWLTRNSQPDSPGLNKKQYLQAYAEHTASYIVSLLQLAAAGRCGFRDDGQLSPLSTADIAILVRDGNEAAAIRSALQQRNLRSVYLSEKENVFQSQQAADLLSWLRAAAEPQSERLLRCALATETLGKSWQELNALVTDERAWEDMVEQLQGYHRRWQQQGVLPMLRQLMQDFALPSQLLARGDERGLTNLLHLAELAQRAAAQLDGEQALIRWLAEHIDNPLSGGNQEEHTLRLESDDALIRIVTIHKSKGLEYPLVFLPYPCTFKPVDGKRLPLRYHDEDHQAQLSLQPEQQQIDAAEKERLGEDLRLLYVALTRARHACWIGMAPLQQGPQKAGSQHTDLHRSAIGHLLNGGQAVAADQLHALLAPLDRSQLCAAPDITAAPAPAVQQPAPLQPARHYRGKPASHWWIASYSALTTGASSQGEAPEDRRDAILSEEQPATAPVEPLTGQAEPGQPQGIHAFAKGPQAGTLLHDILEQAALGGFAQPLAERAELQRLIQRRATLHGWQHDVPTLETWLAEYLATPLPFAEPALPLQQLSREDCQPEMEFWIEASQVDSVALDALVRRYVLPGQPRPALRPDTLNGMLKGFIDLVFKQGERYWVADYKSNWLGPDADSYSMANMASVVLEKRYDVQLCLYLLALHRLLRARLAGDYQPQQQLGGAALLFLRGYRSDNQGVYPCTADPQLLDDLDRLFSGQTLETSQ